MLSRALLADAVDACSKARAPIGPLFLQRRIRVGWATAAHLVDALEAAGVVGPYPERLQLRHGRPVLVTDPDVAITMVEAAITDGRIELTDPDNDVAEAAARKVHESHDPEPDGVRVHRNGLTCRRCCWFITVETSRGRSRVTNRGVAECRPGKVVLRNA